MKPERGFRDPKSIVERYNHSIGLYNKIITAQELGETEQEIQARRDCANALYEAVEWSFKYYLSQKGIRTAPTDGFPILCEKMMAIAIPQFNDPSVNINASLMVMQKWQRNSASHRGEIPDIEEIKCVFSEARKLIITYVNSSAILKEPKYLASTVSNWDAFYEGCNYFYPADNLYMLIVGPSNHLPQEQMDLVGRLPWSIVFDFDRNSRINGFKASQKEELHAIQEITCNDVDSVTFSRFSNKKYWFYADGITERQSTLISRYQDWKAEYGTKIDSLLNEYARAFISPITIVILWDSVPYVRFICEKLYSIFRQRIRFIYAFNNAKAAADLISEAHGDHIPLSFGEIAEGIRNHQGVLQIDSREKTEILLPHNENKYVVMNSFNYRNIEEDLEVLHKNILSFVANSDEERMEFYKGKVITWHGLSNHDDIDRTHTREFVKKIEKQMSTGLNKVFFINHKPGFGGTTIGRRIAWELHHDFPVVMLKNYRENHTHNLVREVYDLTKKTVLVVIESHLIGMAKIEQFVREIDSLTRPVVFLIIKRSDDVHVGTINSDHLNVYTLDDYECKSLIDRYKPLVVTYPEPQKSKKIQALDKLLLTNDPIERNPFFVGLIAFEEDFFGITDYIAKFLTKIKSEEQRTALLYLCVCYYYENKSIPSLFFHSIFVGSTQSSFNLLKYLPANIDFIIVSNRENNVTFWRPRHVLLALEIIKSILSINWKWNLSDISVQFIKDTLSVGGNQSDYISTLLREMFIMREQDEIKDDRFSKLISDIPTEAGKEKVFECLTETYPQEAHFWAHRARYYSFINKNVSRALECAEKAILIKEKKGEKDALLYHIKGMCLRQEIYDLIDDFIKQKREKNIGATNEALNLLQQRTLATEDMFRIAREINKDEYGYIANIQLLLRILDFGSVQSGMKKHEFMKINLNSWYGECKEKIEELLEDVKRIPRKNNSERFINEYSQSLKEYYGDFAKILQLWDQALQKAKSEDKGRIRRNIVRTYLQRDNDFESMDHKTRRRVLDLMEENILFDAENTKNLYFWFQAARYDSQTSVDNAIEKLSRWYYGKEHIVEVCYYLYILKVIKALEGYSDARVQALKLIKECQTQSAKLPNRIINYEWLGDGIGLRRMLNDRKVQDKIRREEDDPRSYVEGLFTEYEHSGAGWVEVDGIPIFIKPKMVNSSIGIDQSYLNKPLKLKIGFSYDGLRSEYSSVRTPDFSQVKLVDRTRNTNYEKNKAPKSGNPDPVLVQSADTQLSRKQIEFKVAEFKGKNIIGIILESGEQAVIPVKYITGNYIDDPANYIKIGDTTRIVIIGKDKFGKWLCSMRPMDLVATDEEREEAYQGPLADQLKNWKKGKY